MIMLHVPCSSHDEHGAHNPQGREMHIIYVGEETPVQNVPGKIVPI